MREPYIEVIEALRDRFNVSGNSVETTYGELAEEYPAEVIDEVVQFLREET